MRVRTIALAGQTLMVAACATTGGGADPNALVLSLADRMVAHQVQYQPTSAYSMGVPAPDHRRWADRSPAGIAAYERGQDAVLADLKRIAPTGLENRTRMLHAAMVERLEADREARICRSQLWNVDHMGGWQLSLVQVAREQPAETADERMQALERWSHLPAFVDREIENARLGLQQGYSAPKPVVLKVIKQVRSLATASPEKSPFYSPAERTQDEAFRQAYGKTLAGPVREALLRYAGFLETEYLPKARDALGVSANPDGRACYQALLRSYTTLRRTPEEVFRIGQETVSANAAVVKEMGQTKFGTRDLALIATRLQEAADNQFGSEQELIDFSRVAVERAKGASARFFERMPEQEMRVEPFLAFQRGSGGSSFYEDNLDPRKPAYYRINSEIWQTETHGSAEITAVHEGYPGHHMQISLANALGTLPITKLTGNAAYVEGWARYSERLAEEAGIYSNEYPLMTRRLWPARGMVADPGLHVFGWSREKVIQFLWESGQFDASKAEDLVDRMAAWPGQLTAYDSGGLEILALREEARKALGDRFDIKAFHQRVLENGAIPLMTLRDNVQRWAASQGAR